MKKYIAPKIKSIKLDPEQAILQICQLGGFYFYNTSSCKAIGFKGSTPKTCSTSIKARSKITCGKVDLSMSNQPS